MRLVDYLDAGAALGTEAPCLALDGHSLSYGEVQALSQWAAGGLVACGVEAGDRVAVLADDDLRALSAVLGCSRAGAVVCPIDRDSGPARAQELLARSEAAVLVFGQAYADLVDEVRPHLPGLTTLVCFDGDVPWATSWGRFLHAGGSHAVDRTSPDDLVVIGSSGIMLTGDDLETMAAASVDPPLTERPVHHTTAPLASLTGVRCLPVLALGGEIVIDRQPTPRGEVDAAHDRLSSAGSPSLLTAVSNLAAETA